MITRNNKWQEFVQHLAIKIPYIIQAPMAGGITTPELVAAVANFGGIGSLATGYLTTQQVRENIHQIKKLTNKPFAANIFIPNDVHYDQDAILNYQAAISQFKDQLGLANELITAKNFVPESNFKEIIEVLIQEDIKIISFAFGVLSADLITLLKKHEIYLIGTANCFDEAKILAQNGIDFIVAQGMEAGGHRGGFLEPTVNHIKTVDLVKEIVSHLDIPVIAAGGIMNGQMIKQFIAIGASSCQLGTAFIITDESGASKSYKNELLKFSKYPTDPTVLTKAYSGKYVRALNNEFIQQIEKTVSNIPAYPIAHYLSSPIRKTATLQSNTAVMGMWCGNNIALIRANLPVKTLMQQLNNEYNSEINFLL